jgi:hypothetical protein
MQAIYLVPEPRDDDRYEEIRLHPLQCDQAIGIIYANGFRIGMIDLAT